MNKKELQNKIEDLEKQFKEKITELKNQFNSIEFEGVKKGVREMPEYQEIYYFFNSDGKIIRTYWYETESDIFRFNIGNCFKTEQEAEEYKENLLTKQALKDLALELNNGVEIDWSDENQNKYVITFYNDLKMLNCYKNSFNKDLGQIYCLDYQFLTIATVRIGKEKLIKLIKSGV